MQAIPFALVAVAIAVLQEGRTPQLGPARFVASEVEAVHWSPNGKALVYVRKGRSGHELGVYDAERGTGAEVRQLAEDETVLALDWLGSGRKAVATLRRDGARKVSTLCCLDAAGQTCDELWSRPAEEGARIDLHITPSPTLDHALVSVVTSIPGPGTGADEQQSEEDWVILLGGKRMVRAGEVTAAKHAGFYFAAWSLDGSAIFSKLNLFEPVPRNPSGGGMESVSEAGDIVALQLQLDGDGQAHLPVRALIGGAWLTPETGSVVMECMPPNAVLRQVRFRGPYQDVRIEPRTETKAIPQTLRERDVEEGVRWLWLVPPQGRYDWPPSLVSAQSDAERLAPDGMAVAFVWNGALFVRRAK